MLSFLGNNNVLQVQFSYTDSKTEHNSFTISYLINTCGLSPQKAISISKKIHFESSTNPDSVLTLFRNNGFSNSHISKITAAYPRLLVSNADKTLKPKFDFFNSKGLSGNDFRKVLTKEANVLTASLENTIIPSFDCLKSLVGTDEKVIIMLKKSTTVLRINHERKLAPKLGILRALGVPDSVVAKLLVSHPRMFMVSSVRFNEIVAQVKKMEFDPCQYTFLAAIQALTALSLASLEAKFDVYRSWGWSEEEIRRAFRKAPTCMLISKESIMSKMNCLVKKFGFAPSYIAKQPSVLTYSYKRRILPRCSVMQVLIKTHQLKKVPTLCTLLTMSEEMFLMKYLTRYEEEIPELNNVYLQKIR